MEVESRRGPRERPVSARTFIDSNILIYTYDDGAPAKRDRSRALVHGLMESGTGVISTQVMQEFVAVASRKLGLPPLTAKAALRIWASLDTVQITPDLVHAAIDEMVLHRLSFWDSLIVAAAASAHCAELLTEDLHHGQTIRGVTVRNPFA